MSRNRDRKPHQYKQLLKLPDEIILKFSGRSLEFFLLMVFGFMIVCVISLAFNASHIANILPTVVDWTWRLGLILICFIATAMILESLFNSNKHRDEHRDEDREKSL